jgi:hypothetical protein
VKQQYLGPQNTEDLGRMLLALLSEFWILRDRVAVLEEMLAEKQDISSAAIDAYVPSPEFEERLRVLRDRVATSVVGAPLLADNRSVDDILRHAGLPPRPAQT